MTQEDFRNLLFRVAAIEARYDDWLQDEAQKLAGVMGCTAGEAWRSMCEEYMRAIEPYSVDEITEVLNEIAGTHRELPSYSQLWRAIAGYAADNRQAVRDAEKYRREDDRKYTCAVCRDTGIVVVWNPHFVEWFRPTFERYEQEGWPTIHHPDKKEPASAWEGPARSEWITRATGQPWQHSALCNCSCKRRERLAAELMAFNAGNRKVRGQAAGPPACGLAQYVPDRMPLCGPFIEWQQELRDWYATHDPLSANEWRPAPNEYAERFGR